MAEKVTVKVGIGGEHLVLEGTPEQMRRVRRTLENWRDRYAVEVVKLGRPVGSRSRYTSEEMAKAREWARGVGMSVAARGPVSGAVVETYRADLEDLWANA